MTVNADPFAEVRLNKIPSIKPKEQENQDLNDPFSEVRIKEAEGMPFIKETGRHAARIGSRIAETLGGIPGDTSTLIQSGIFKGLEKLTGQEIFVEIAKESVKRKRPITTQGLQEFSEEATGGITKAQGPTEEKVDRVVRTVTSLLGPMKFRQALGVGLGSELAYELGDVLKLPEPAKEGLKLGTMFLLSMYNPGGAMKYAAQNFEKANAFARGASIQAHHFQGNLQNLVNDLKKGFTTSSKNAVIKPAEELIDKVKNGKILVQDLTASKRDVSTLMGDPSLLKREKKLLKGLGREIDKAIKPYEKINPSFSKAYRPANQIYAAIMEGNKASNFIKKTLGAKSVIGASLAEVALGHPEFVVPTAAAAGGALGAAKFVDFTTRLAKSPELQKYYSKALIAAAKQDAASLRIYADKIDEILQ